MPIELGFILERLAEMAEADESLREKQPWKAAYEQDYAWLGEVITKHYHGDDSDVKVLMGGHPPGVRGQSVEDYARRRRRLPARRKHPTLGRAFHECGYLPMVELLALPRGERVHELHRLGRRPRLHAAGHRGDLRHPLRAGDRQLERAALHRRRARRHGHATRPRRTSSTTARSSRCGSGAGSGGGRSSPAATRTATSRCCGTPAGRVGPPCGCSSCTTTRSASSPTPPAPRSRSRRPRAGLDGGQHQERLGDRVRRLIRSRPLREIRH